MAKKSSDELLGQILNLLDETLGEVKKKKVAGESNAVPLSGAITVDAKSIKTVGDALKILGQAIIPITKISEKDLDKVTNTIKKISETMTSIVMDKEQMQAFYMMATAFEKIAEVIDKISGNFFKSFFKFGPVSAHIIGRRMSRFYKIILKYLVGALQEVMDPSSKIKNPDELKAKLEAMSSLAKLMVFDVKPADLKKIIGMSMVLTEKRGRNIAKFYTALIEELAKVDPDGKTTARAIDLVKQIGKLIAILTISLIAIVALTILAPVKNVAAGLLLLGGMVVGVYFLMKALASKDFKKASKGMVYGLLGIAVLIISLTLSLALLTVITDKYETKVILGALALLVTVVLVSAGLMWLLSRNNIKKSSKESLITVAAILVLFLGMSLSMMLAIEVGKKGKEALIGGLLVVAFAVGGAYLIKFLAKLKKTTILKGLLGTAGVALMIAGISAAMLVFGEFLKKLNGITDKTIACGIGLTVAMIAGVIGLAHLLSPLAIDPLFWAGFGMVETIAIMIASISGAMLLFSNLLKEIKNLSKEDIQDAVDKLIMKDGMVDALRSIIDALDDFGIKSAIKVAAIGKAIQPVISSISQFVDVIQKMASMKIADAWDKNGKPTHYMRLKPEAFKKAAINLSQAFSVFVTELGKAFSKIGRKARKNMKKLSGPITEIIKGVAALIEPLTQIASGKIQVGNEVVSVDLNKILEARNGIVNVITGIFGPLNELAEQDIKHRKIKKLFKTFRKSMKQLFKLFKYADKAKIKIDDSILDKLNFLTKGGSIIIDFLNKDFEDAYTNAKIFKKALKPFRKSVKSLFELFKYTMEIGIPIDDNYIKTITTLRTGLVKILALLQLTDYLKTAKKNSKTLIDIFSNFVKGYKTLFKTVKFEKMDKTFIEQTANLVEGLSNIVGFLTELDSGTVTTTKRGLFGHVRTQSVSKLIYNSRMFKEAMKNTAAGINHIKPFLSATPKQIIDLADAMKKLDAELIVKEEQRTKAIQSVASNFKDMAAGVNQLNSAMTESMRLTRLYSAMKALTSGNIISKGVNAAVEGAEKMGNIVKDALTQNKHEEQKKIEEEQKKQDREELAAVIGNAVSAALTAWSESHKELTVQFSDSPEKIFGEIRNG